jgi:hypothetical protein
MRDSLNALAMLGGGQGINVAPVIAALARRPTPDHEQTVRVLMRLTDIRGELLAVKTDRGLGRVDLTSKIIARLAKVVGGAVAVAEFSDFPTDPQKQRAAINQKSPRPCRREASYLTITAQVTLEPACGSLKRKH